MSLAHPLLTRCGVAHGFGLRGDPERPGVMRPRQVHGVAVARASASAAPGDADAIVSDLPAVSVAVVTADCVPVLVASQDGRAVAAVHAGWRGLAAGVVPRAIEALRERLPAHARLSAAVGPCIGACCYEIDRPVIDAMTRRFPDEVDAALTPVRGEHARLDLALLVRVDLARAGLAPEAVGGFEAACTFCDRERFYSYRRDGAGAGRLLHWIAAGGREA